jgi:hypothetical protein
MGGEKFLSEGEGNMISGPICTNFCKLEIKSITPVAKNTSSCATFLLANFVQSPRDEDLLEDLLVHLVLAGSVFLSSRGRHLCQPKTVGSRRSTFWPEYLFFLRFFTLYFSGYVFGKRTLAY